MFFKHFDLQVRSCRRPLVSICDGTEPEVIVDFMMESVMMTLTYDKYRTETETDLFKLI